MIVLLSIRYLASRRLCTKSKSKVANLCNYSLNLDLNLELEPWLELRVGDNLLLQLFSFLGIDVNGSKTLSPTPSVSNLSLRPGRYLSTVIRSSSQGSVNGFRR